MKSPGPAVSRRGYLALTGTSLTGLVGCLGSGETTTTEGTEVSSDDPVGTRESEPTEGATETPSPADSSTATARSATPAAGSFPLPPGATASDLRSVMDLSRRRSGGGRHERLIDPLFFVNGPDGLEVSGFEIESADETLSWYDANASVWALEREEPLQMTGSFATDEMAPDHAGGGIRGRPNRLRWYRAGDRGTFLWIRGIDRPGGPGTHWLVVVTGPWSALTEVTVDYPKRPYERENLPKFLTHGVSNIANVVRVSKFRSGYGHSHTADFESCRTNKHYLSGDPDLEVVPRYAPVSGTVHQIMQDGEEDLQIYLVPDGHPEFVVRQEHIVLNDEIEVGMHVDAGDHLGDWRADRAKSGPYSNAGEILVHMRTPDGTALVSFFNVMSDEVFARWAERGADFREDYIISKSVRDANANTCTEEFYDETVTVDGGDWVWLKEEFK